MIATRLKATSKWWSFWDKQSLKLSVVRSQAYYVHVNTSHATFSSFLCLKCVDSIWSKIVKMFLQKMDMASA